MAEDSLGLDIYIDLRFKGSSRDCLDILFSPLGCILQRVECNL
jgi:hypothetical protein